MLSTPPLTTDTRIHRATPEFRRVRLALFLAGFSSFALIYCVQPLLPEFALTFGLSPAASSLALSLTTGFLALSILIMGGWSQGLGRKEVMTVSMFGGALLNIAVAFLPGWHSLLIARAVEGIVLGGVPAVAMAYLAEEMAPEDLGKAMGLYIGGTAFGAMMGRVGMGALTEIGDWRMAMGVLGALCLASAIGFALLLPPSRNFVPQRHVGLGYHIAAWTGHLKNPALRRLYLIGFCLTSIFVTMFNYSTFLLTGEKFGLGPSQVSLIFLAFAFGMVSSPVAGNLLERMGRRPLLIAAFVIMLAGILVTLFQTIPAIALGVSLITIGFFVAHSVASSAVGAAAVGSKGHASSLYLLFYYIGSSVIGSVGGWFWQHGGWPSVVGLTVVMALIGLFASAFGARVGSYKG